MEPGACLVTSIGKHPAVCMLRAKMYRSSSWHTMTKACNDLVLKKHLVLIPLELECSHSLMFVSMSSAV